MLIHIWSCFRIKNSCMKNQVNGSMRVYNCLNKQNIWVHILPNSAALYQSWFALLMTSAPPIWSWNYKRHLPFLQKHSLINILSDDNEIISVLYMLYWIVQSNIKANMNSNFSESGYILNTKATAAKTTKNYKDLHNTDFLPGSTNLCTKGGQWLSRGTYHCHRFCFIGEKRCWLHP